LRRPGPLFLDQTGATLWDLDFDGNACANIYQSFRIDKAKGELECLGSDGANASFNNRLSFIGNNPDAADHAVISLRTLRNVRIRMVRPQLATDDVSQFFWDNDNSGNVRA
jgi:hypothetical protein